MNNQAVADYSAVSKKVLTYADQLRLHILTEKPNTSEINYGHVGSLVHVAALLQEIKEFLNVNESGVDHGAL